jgi:hypothetical protein
MVIANAAIIADQFQGVGRGSTRTNGSTTRPAVARANGKRTKTGRLSAVTPPATPSRMNVRMRGSSTADTASHIVMVNHSVVHTSVSTSGTKYGIAGKSAVSSAPSHAVRADMSRRPIAKTSRHVTANSASCANATGSCPTPNNV